MVCLPVQEIILSLKLVDYLKLMDDLPCTGGIPWYNYYIHNKSGPGCSKLTTSLVNISLNFLKLISQICQYFLLKKFEKL